MILLTKPTSAAITVSVIACMMLLMAGCGTSSTEPNSQPNAPSNPNPANGAVDQSVHTTLTWSASDPDGDDLTFSVYFGIAPSDPSLVSSNQGSKTFLPTDPQDSLLYGTTYRWKVKAKDPDGLTATGPIWSFETEYAGTQLPPYEPFDPEPADGQQNASTTPLLEWTSSDPNGDPIQYTLYLGTEANPPVYQTGLTNPYYQVMGLFDNTTYYWKVVAADTNGQTEGPIWSFKTVSLPQNQVAPFGSLPRLSPDGNKAVFGAGGVSQGLWVYDFTTDALTQLTDDSYPHLYDYRWHPDSDQIAFGGAGSTVEGTSGIFVVTVEASPTVTRWHPTGHSPCWIEDGDLVFVEEDAQAGNYGLYRITSMGGTTIPLTTQGLDPQTNRTGSKVAYRVPVQGDSDFLLNVLTIGSGSTTTLANACLHFVWTADGANIVYDYLGTSGLVMSYVPSSGGASTTITSGGTEPSISDNGLIAFQKANGDLSQGIYTIDISGSGSVQRAYPGFTPDISRDGTRIVYARDDGIWKVEL